MKILLSLLICGSLGWSAETEAASLPERHLAESAMMSRTVQYSDQDVIQIKTKLRYMTLVVLPKQEQILDFTCGDKDWWVISGTQNFAYIKPAKAGARTNVNLITASGNVYSFLLTEVSQEEKTEPDVKVFVELKEGSMREAAGKPHFYSEDQVKDYLHQVDIANDRARQAQQSTQSAIDSGISRFISNVRFPYRFEAGKKPFLVRAMYHDDKFTYIQARPEETPALYEIKDGKPNLINFQYRDGVYVAEKILDRGYLAIGKAKLPFTRSE
jgi:type IV secretion system protein VirB9